ncbi:hypothetical protein NPJ82_06305 [Sphingomonas sp. NY01]|uniref:hypothetical protein n=1 Tax=Sphingomonas sp. NY01 TaxID=2968057 RepID=UPI00315CA095
MRAIALVDLDDTLFQTRAKCPEDLADEALTPIGFAVDGAPLSYATPRQMRFIEWLAETTHLVPVTGRSLDALRRVNVPFAAGVCAHGGVVLGEDGEPDEGWAAEIARAAADHAGALDGYAAAIAHEAEAQGVPLRVRVLEEAGVPIYTLAKHPEADHNALFKVVDAAIPDVPAGWTLHRNGNNVAMMPPYLGKANAVAHLLPGLRARFPEASVIGVGDSLTDAPFMALCDFAMLPTRSQLADRLFA